MGRLVVINHLTLDGVMQAPGRPDEDERAGFAYGGWAIPGNDEVMGQFMAQGMGGGGALLLGRRTYEDFAGFWPKQGDDNPYASFINEQTKYVASRTLTEPLTWRHATLLKGDAVKGDAAAAIGELKRQTDLAVLGSGDLVQTLLANGLVDEFVLMTHPLVLGTGRRLFPDGTAKASLRLLESVATTTGVIIGRYAPA
jgi:dihydrofolate reductase